MDTSHFDTVATLFADRLLSRRRLLATSAATGAILTAGLPMFANAQTPTAVEYRETPDDWQGMVDPGGRTLFMDTDGSGGPTVVLVSRLSLLWHVLDRRSPPARRAAIDGHGRRLRVHPCRGVRPPGDIRPHRPGGHHRLPVVTRSPSRAPARMPLRNSTRCSRPRLSPAPMSSPTHSLGGLFARLYASTYPDDVVGMILVDAYSERLEALAAARALGSPGAIESRVLARDTVEADSGLRRSGDDRIRRRQPGHARGGRRLTAAADAPGRPRPRPGHSPSRRIRQRVHVARSLEGILLEVQREPGHPRPECPLHRCGRQRPRHPPGSASARDRSDPAGG